MQHVSTGSRGGPPEPLTAPRCCYPEPAWGWRVLRLLAGQDWTWTHPQRRPDRPVLHLPIPHPPHTHTTIPTYPQQHKRLSQPKGAFYFQRVNVEGGGEAWPYPVLAAGQVLEGRPQKSRNRGLRVCPTKAETPLAPGQEAATPSPHPSQETCQVAFSPYTLQTLSLPQQKIKKVKETTL